MTKATEGSEGTQGGDAVRERVERAAQGLSRLRDELRVQLHLAGMEAERAWEALEPHVSHTETRLRHAAESARHGAHDRKATLEMHLALMDVRDRLREMEPALHALGQRIQQAGAEAAASVPDPVKLQARLASMDAADALQARRREVERGIQEVEAFGRRLAEEIVALLERLALRRRDA